MPPRKKKKTEPAAAAPKEPPRKDFPTPDEFACEVCRETCESGGCYSFRCHRCNNAIFFKKYATAREYLFSRPDFCGECKSAPCKGGCDG
jgi:hypothetical protein